MHGLKCPINSTRIVVAVQKRTIIGAGSRWQVGTRNTRRTGRDKGCQPMGIPRWDEECTRVDDPRQHRAAQLRFARERARRRLQHTCPCMTEICLHFLCAHQGLHGNAPAPGRQAWRNGRTPPATQSSAHLAPGRRQLPTRQWSAPRRWRCTGLVVQQGPGFHIIRHLETMHD